MHCFFAILLVASMAVAISAQRPSCPRNMHFEQCGTSCPSRCDFDSTKARCIGNCKAGCFCNDGFVLDKPDGDCIRREQCPNQLRCDRNEEVKQCGACDQTCNQDRKLCSQICRQPECGCRDGFLRDSQGRCVPESQCRSSDDCSRIRCRSGTECRNGQCVALDELRCDRNEEVKHCGACDQTCNQDRKVCHRICRQPECGCRDGFLRDSRGRCVPESQCKSFDDCSRIRCRSGTECRNGQCVALDDNQCHDNEEFKECGTACEPSCDKPEIRFCTLNCILNTCQCKKGFFRDSDRLCVPLHRCPRRLFGDTKKTIP